MQPVVLIVVSAYVKFNSVNLYTGLQAKTNQSHVQILLAKTNQSLTQKVVLESGLMLFAFV